MLISSPKLQGSWQYTSVNLLNDPKGVKIPDELESILLILIYYSIRYVTSSIPSRAAVAGFLDDCFDCFTLEGGKLMCGERKDTLVREGKLAHYQPQSGFQDITFNGSPLDYLLSESLKRFAAKYKVTAYDSWTVENRGGAATAPPIPIVRNGVQLVYVIDKHAALDDDPEAATFEAGLGPQPDASASWGGQGKTEPPEPTSEERELAANVWAHKWLAWMFRRSLNSAGWEKVERVKRDRVPKGWVSPHPIIPRDSSSGHHRTV